MLVPTCTMANQIAIRLHLPKGGRLAGSPLGHIVTVEVRARVLDIVDLSNVTPGLQIKSGDNGANPRIFIRGVGVNDFNPATNSAVGIYADGVYVASPLAQRFAFFDLQQAEVLRGPQGTLYGRNTTGGTINVTSRKPGEDFEADLLADYGRFDAVDVQGGVSAPIVGHRLSVRVSGLYEKDDGYTLNRLSGHRGNDADRLAVRGSVRLTPTAAITDDLAMTYGKSRAGAIQAYNRTLLPASVAAAGPDGLCAPAYYRTGQCTNLLGYANMSGNLYQGDYRFEGKDKVDLLTVANTLTIGLGAADLVSVTGYQHAKRDDREESDDNPLPNHALRFREFENVRVRDRQGRTSISFHGRRQPLRELQPRGEERRIFQRIRNRPRRPGALQG